MSTSLPPPGYQPPPAYGSEPVAAGPAAAPRVKRPAGLRSRLLAGGLALAVAVAAAFALLGSTNSQVTDPVAQAATLSSGTAGFRLNLYMTMTSTMFPAPVV